MRFGRAVLFGALLWILIFFEVSILMFGFGLNNGDTAYYIAHYLLLIVLAVFVARLYFRKSGKKGFAEGLFVGVVFALVSIILDAIITIPLFIKDYSFFLDAFLWIGIIEGVVITGIVGALKK